MWEDRAGLGRNVAESSIPLPLSLVLARGEAERENGDMGTGEEQLRTIMGNVWINS